MANDWIPKGWMEYNPYTQETRKRTGFDASNIDGMRWDDVVNYIKGTAYNGAEGQGQGTFADAMPLINGGAVQVYNPTGIQELPQGWDASLYPEMANYWNNVSLNYKDPNGPDGMMTALSRNPDGTVYKGHYQEKDGFLGDMAKFALAATGMYAGIGALGGEAATSAGTSAATAASDQLPNEWAKLVAQNAAEPGTLLNTSLPTVATTAGTANAFSNVLNGASEFLKSPLTQVGASVISGAMGQNAANKAADAQTAAANSAIAEQRRQYDQTRTDLAPWRDRGTQAANKLAVMMGLAGNAQDPAYKTGFQAVPTYSAPNRNAFAQYVPFK